MTGEVHRVVVEKEQVKQDAFRFRLLVCHSSPCRASGAEAVYEVLVQTVKERNLDAKVDVTCTGCTARCTDGPLVTVCIPGKEDVIYENVTPEFVIKILEKHALKNKVLE